MLIIIAVDTMMLFYTIATIYLSAFKVLCYSMSRQSMCLFFDVI